ncbi:MAG: hypothetical protein ILP11_01740 [Alphaproteobacteria bacterium]|nr:hypothetical protein [Alphaproteobacteria bacterium]
MKKLLALLMLLSLPVGAVELHDVEMNKLNIEKAVRCQTSTPALEVVQSVVVQPGELVLWPVGGDTLPAFNVDKFEASQMPLDAVLQELVAEAGIKVCSDDGVFPNIAVKGLEGSLQDVVWEIARLGDAFVRYDAVEKTLHVARQATFEVHMPAGRLGMYAIIDALRGAKVFDMKPDWSENVLYLNLNSDTYAITQNLLDTIRQRPQLLVWDVKFYRLSPEIADWEPIVKQFGAKRVNSSLNGLAGRLLISDHQKKGWTMVQDLEKRGSVTPVCEGIAVMPANFDVLFSLGLCSDGQGRDLVMNLKGEVYDTDKMQTKFSVSTKQGEITAFDAIYDIDDTLDVIDLPNTIFGPTAAQVEYFITIKPRLVRLMIRE